MDFLVFLLHLFSTLFMTGMIWFVQVVHYPLFAKVPAAAFAAHQRDHLRLTGYAVVPPMLIELCSGGYLLAVVTYGPPAWVLWSGATLLAAIWIATCWLIVPLHKKLNDGFDIQTHRSLVRCNWFRTIAWTLRSILLLWLLAQY